VPDSKSELAKVEAIDVFAALIRARRRAQRNVDIDDDTPAE